MLKGLVRFVMSGLTAEWSEQPQETWLSLTAVRCPLIDY